MGIRSRLLNSFLVGFTSILDVFGAGMPDPKIYRLRPRKSAQEAMADDARKLQEDARKIRLGK